MDTSPLSPPLPSVLIVDDEPDICMALSDFLKHDGYAVRAVQAGRDALREVKRGQVGVVILDFGLPDLSGLDVLRGVKKLAPQLPVIVLTASTHESLAVEALHCGAFTYLSKPYNSYELRFALRQIADAQRLVSKVARVEGDLSASEERFQTVVGTTPDVVVLADRKIHSLHESGWHGMFWLYRGGSNRSVAYVADATSIQRGASSRNNTARDNRRDPRHGEDG